MATSGSNQKTKIHTSLKIQFQVGSVLYKIAKFSKNITPLQPPFQHPQLGIWAPNQKSTPSILFASLNPFQMVWHDPVASKTEKLSHFWQKAWHQPSNPWKFHSNWSNCWKINQQFNYHGITLTTWPRVTQGGLRSKNKRKFNFGRGAFYKELPNSQKNLSPLVSPSS